MLKSLNRYLKNDEFSMNIWDKYININNFADIIVLEDNKVVLTAVNKKLTIKGKNIKINKLLDNEILLCGDFSSIEMGEQNV